ncbi:hypothetical protein MHK_004135, partial [Candidatus Magnetomorum sp. HK-1]
GLAPFLNYSPEKDYYGLDTFTFVTNDGFADSEIAVIDIQIKPENDLPTISGVQKKISSNMNIPVTLNFNVKDIDSGNVEVSASSSDDTLIRSLQLTGSGLNQTLTINPEKDSYGTATITLKADDSFDFTTTSFELTINNVLISLPSSEGFLNDYVIVPLIMNNSNVLIDKIDISIRVDNSDMLIPKGVSLIGSILQHNNFVLNQSVNNFGVISFTLETNTPVQKSGVIANLEFSVTNNQKYIGKTTDLFIDKAILNNDQMASTKGVFKIGGFSISGKVEYFGDDSKPIRNALISIEGDGSYTTTTNSQGLYTLYGMPPGDYTITVSKQDDLSGLSGTDSSRISRIAAKILDSNCVQKIASDSTMNGSTSGMDRSRVSRYVAKLINCL